MADLGSLANLITDINAKVTTNGVQENTGSRVNESMRNMADTLANLPALVEFAETWRFLTDTTDTDPGSGFFQVNNATVASVTELYISRTSHSGADLDAWINNWPGAGVLALFGDDPANALIFIVSSISPWSGYYKMTLTYGSGTIPGAGDVFRFVFITSAAGGSTAFADITGDPSDNTLLDAALNAKQDSDAELSAIAGLTSAADKVPYFTGSGTAALADLTSAARTVLDDTTVGAMVNTLGGASATGTGGLVRASAPTLTNPVVGTQTAGDNSTKAASTAYVAAALATAVAGLLEFQGPVDCSANPNYPAALKGDTYYVSVAGKIGGASGISVDVGDAVIASADNAGGTQASVGTSWFILEHNLAGALLAANNLSDLTNAGTARTNLGLGTAATQASTAFDAAGDAATAESNANDYTDNALADRVQAYVINIPVPANGTTFLYHFQAAGTILRYEIRCTTGTFDPTVKINTTAVTNLTGHTTTSSLVSFTASGANTASAGDELNLTIASASAGAATGVVIIYFKEG